MISLKKILYAVPVLMVASAFAEGGRFCIGGDLNRLTTVQLHACESQLQHVRAVASRYNIPDWHFIIVCDEKGWTDYAALSDTAADTLKRASADTNLPLHTTFFRGSRLASRAGDEILVAEMTDIVRRSRVQLAASR